MFICENCGQITTKGTPSYKVTTKKRKKTYINTGKRGKTKQTEGWEIVKEITVCPECKSDFANPE